MFQDSVDAFHRICNALIVLVPLVVMLSFSVGYLNEGVKFHTEILGEFLEPMKNTVADFSLARGMETRVVLEDLTQQLANTSLSVIIQMCFKFDV